MSLLCPRNQLILILFYYSLTHRWQNAYSMFIDGTSSGIKVGIRLSATASKLSATSSRLSATGSRLSATGNRLSATSNRLSATGSRLSATGSRLSTTGSRLSVTSSRLSATGSRLSAIGSRLPAISSRLKRLAVGYQRQAVGLLDNSGILFFRVKVVAMVFERLWLRIPAPIPAILTEVFMGFSLCSVRSREVPRMTSLPQAFQFIIHCTA